MKNIYKKVNISPFFILIILLSLISGLFRDIICLFTVIIIHELGHIFVSLLYKWNIKKIDITLCGGYITYDENIDKSFFEEFLIAISGILMQLLFYFIAIILYKYCVFDLDILFLIRKYNYSILLFNLLPIVPLDGSKILNIFFNIYFPYKKSLIITNLISLFSIALILSFIIFNKMKLECSYIVILSFLISKIIKIIKEVPYLFNRFLFERYQKPITIKKYTYIKDGNIANMKRQKQNYFRINGKYYSEKDILRKRFD